MDNLDQCYEWNLQNRLSKVYVKKLRQGWKAEWEDGLTDEQKQALYDEFLLVFHAKYDESSRRYYKKAMQENGTWKETVSIYTQAGLLYEKTTHTNREGSPVTNPQTGSHIKQTSYIYAAGQKLFAQVEGTIADGAAATVSFSYVAYENSTAVNKTGNYATSFTPEMIKYMINDQIGSTRVMLDGNGNVDWFSSYEPFGQNTNEKSFDEQTTTDQCFTSYTRDMEIGLQYAMNRYMDSSLGRFISEDPAKDGQNWYVYASNNPLRWVDPTGLAEVKGASVYDDEEEDNFVSDPPDDMFMHTETIDLSDFSGDDDDDDTPRRSTPFIPASAEIYYDGNYWSPDQLKFHLEQEMWFWGEEGFGGEYTELNTYLELFGETDGLTQVTESLVLRENSPGIVEVVTESIIKNELGRIESKSKVHNFNDLINTKNLSDIIAKNIGTFDKITQNFLKSMSHKELGQYLTAKRNNVRVFEVNPYSVFGSLILMTLKGSDMMGIENTILVNSTSYPGGITSNGISKFEAGLLGHEFIHNIQTDAYGGIGYFISTYLGDSLFYGYKNMPQEVSAYNFGGNSKNSRYVELFNKKQIFNRPENKNWWIK